MDEEAAARRYEALGRRLYKDRLARGERQQLRAERRSLLGTFGPGIRRMNVEKALAATRRSFPLAKPSFPEERTGTGVGAVVVLLLDDRGEVVQRLDKAELRGKSLSLWAGGPGYQGKRLSPKGRETAALILRMLADGLENS